MNVPDDRSYSKDHEWALLEGGRVRVGITDFAQDALGDVVFVELPSVGAEVGKSEAFGTVESTKSVSEIYAPVSGKVVEVNLELNDSPNRINDDPYGAGWLCVIEPSDAGGMDALLTAAAYRELIQGKLE